MQIDKNISKCMLSIENRKIRYAPPKKQKEKQPKTQKVKASYKQLKERNLK